MRNIVLTTVIGLFALMAGCTSDESTITYREYYVDPYGDNTTGDGTVANPWQTIQYALDHVEYDGTTPPKINLNRGRYHETIMITKNITIQGVGSGAPTRGVRPNLPGNEVSSIEGVFGTFDPIIIEGDIRVNIHDVSFLSQNIEIRKATVYMDSVDIRAITGRYGILIEDSPLCNFNAILMGTQNSIQADYAIEAVNTTALIINNATLGFEVYNKFDHIIDIKNTHLTIKNSILKGSEIHNADGIRMREDASAIIEGNTIFRDIDTAEPPGGPRPDLSHAGVSSILVSDKNVTINVVNNRIEGFEKGIAFASAGVKLKVMFNEIHGINGAVRIDGRYSGRLNQKPNVVDFGGGPLGSQGENVFHGSGDYTFSNESKLNIMACSNVWLGLSAGDSPAVRIYDIEDDATFGKVTWTGCDDL